MVQVRSWQPKVKRSDRKANYLVSALLARSLRAAGAVGHGQPVCGPGCCSRTRGLLAGFGKAVPVQTTQPCGTTFESGEVKRSRYARRTDVGDCDRALTATCRRGTRTPAHPGEVRDMRTERASWRGSPQTVSARRGRRDGGSMSGAGRRAELVARPARVSVWAVLCCAVAVSIGLLGTPADAVARPGIAWEASGPAVVSRTTVTGGCRGVRGASSRPATGRDLRWGGAGPPFT
jgi:hypothetical protein